MGNGGVTITAYQDGPYLVRGPFQMLDQEGREIVLHRRTIALCRCGKSQLRPLCDGTHRAIGFRARSGAEGLVSAEPSPVEPPSAPIVEASSRNGAGSDQRPAPARIFAHANGSSAHANGSSRLQNSGPAALLRIVRDAEQHLIQALTGPCTAADYAAMSLAEPLLTAARRLLEWGAPCQEPLLPPCEVDGHGAPHRAVASSKDLVIQALAIVQRLDFYDDPILAQVRSLLGDAGKAMSR
jgi:CDGSH-type Zn-finger protein